VEPSFILSVILGVAGIGGSVFTWSSKRFEVLDRRVDQLEVVINKDFVRKGELMPMISRLEQQIQHIDEKLDRILLHDRNFSS